MNDAHDERAAHLLRQMHRVLSHDLPNQVVAIQSLLQLLEMEDLGRLSADGREYVGRLTRVARQAGSMTRFLKEMGRLHGYQGRAEDVELAVLLPEIQAELEPAYPDQHFEYRVAWAEPAVRADGRLLQLALAELLRHLLGRSPAERCEIHLASRPHSSGVEIRGEVSGKHAAPPREQPAELVLAREWLTVAGGSLLSLDDAAERRAFSVLVPRAASHG